MMELVSVPHVTSHPSTLTTPLTPIIVTPLTFLSCIKILITLKKLPADNVSFVLHRGEEWRVNTYTGSQLKVQLYMCAITHFALDMYSS